MGPNVAYASVRGLYLTVADSLATLPINNNMIRTFIASEDVDLQDQQNVKFT